MQNVKDHVPLVYFHITLVMQKKKKNENVITTAACVKRLL